jgi:hypothetical protein
MTTINQMFCASLVNSIRADVEKAGFKTHRDLSILRFHESRGPRFFCEFTTTLPTGSKIVYRNDIHTDSASDARYQAWNDILSLLGVEGYKNDYSF